ncbi:hypothetical protein BGZ76_001633 [Entomortierella beljakovae]|nr:hypothetical protein BGZ76_001633 [Entomortierella beljakovae]
MGILKLFCTATDGRTIYGLAAAGNYSLPDATPGLIENTLIILVKSNLDPVSLASLTWSVVSTVKLSSIYDITQSKRRELCLVDDKGVFTYMGQNVLKSSGDSTGVFGGVQYSPWDRYIASMDTTSSNSLGQPLPIASSSPIESMDNTDIFQPMGVSNGGTAFALIQQTDPSTNTSTLSALNLNLGQAGAWQRVDYLVNITDTLGVNPNPDLSPGPKSSNPSIRWIAGSVSGGLIVLAMIFYFGYYRRRRDQRLKDKIAALDEMKELGDQKQEVNNLEDSTKIDPNPTTTTQQTQIDPRLLQQFRLTSHPRPNMVATATQDDVSDSRTTLNPQGAPLNPQLRYEYGQEPPSNPPRIPSHSRPLVPACEPHAIVPTEYHIPPNNPHADISPPTIRVEEIIPSIWDPVIHAPHTEPNF